MISVTRCKSFCGTFLVSDVVGFFVVIGAVIVLVIVVSFIESAIRFFRPSKAKKSEAQD